MFIHISMHIRHTGLAFPVVVHTTQYNAGRIRSCMQWFKKGDMGLWRIYLDV